MYTKDYDSISRHLSLSKSRRTAKGWPQSPLKVRETVNSAKTRNQLKITNQHKGASFSTERGSKRFTEREEMSLQHSSPSESSQNVQKGSFRKQSKKDQMKQFVDTFKLDYDEMINEDYYDVDFEDINATKSTKLKNSAKSKKQRYVSKKKKSARSGKLSMVGVDGLASQTGRVSKKQPSSRKKGILRKNPISSNQKKSRRKLLRTTGNVPKGRLKQRRKSKKGLSRRSKTSRARKMSKPKNDQKIKILDNVAQTEANEGTGEPGGTEFLIEYEGDDEFSQDYNNDYGSFQNSNKMSQTLREPPSKHSHQDLFVDGSKNSKKIPENQNSKSEKNVESEAETDKKAVQDNVVDDSGVTNKESDFAINSKDDEFGDNENYGFDDSQLSPASPSPIKSEEMPSNDDKNGPEDENGKNSESENPVRLSLEEAFGGGVDQILGTNRGLSEVKEEDHDHEDQFSKNDDFGKNGKKFQKNNNNGGDKGQDGADDALKGQISLDGGKEDEENPIFSEEENNYNGSFEIYKDPRGGEDPFRFSDPDPEKPKNDSKSKIGKSENLKDNSLQDLLDGDKKASQGLGDSPEQVREPNNRSVLDDSKNGEIGKEEKNRAKNSDLWFEKDNKSGNVLIEGSGISQNDEKKEENEEEPIFADSNKNSQNGVAGAGDFWGDSEKKVGGHNNDDDEF